MEAAPVARTLRLSAGLILLLNPLAGRGAGDVPVETFVPPVAIEQNTPAYPRQNRLRRREGWVNLVYMVDPEGRTYDVTVAASSDNEHFEQAAVRAVEGWLYEPARFQDEAIDAGRNVVLTFEIEGQKGAHRAFIKQQRQLVEQVAEGNQVAATELMDALFQRERNLFEEAYLHLATYDYHVKWGTPEQQLHALNRAAFVDKGREFLPPGVLTNVLTRKLALELKSNRLAQAQRTANRLLERRVKQDIRQALQRTLAEIDAVAASDQGVAVSGHIGRSLRYVHPLLKRAFEIQEVQGRIAELHLHCARDYVGFSFLPDLRYHVEPDQTECRVIVIGDPDTRFTLVES